MFQMDIPTVCSAGDRLLLHVLQATSCQGHSHLVVLSFIFLLLWSEVVSDLEVWGLSVKELLYYFSSCVVSEENM